MVFDDDFQTALDADITNSALRLVFADWLEEQGDERAVGYRWLGENGKWPYDWAREQSDSGFKSFDWYFPDAFVSWEVPEHCRLPVEFRKAFETPCHFVPFESRRAAENGICAVLIRSPELRRPARPWQWQWWRATLNLPEAR